MSHDITYLHIKRALEKDTECFLCTLENEIEQKYIDTYLSELVMDASSRNKIIKSRGFCNDHFYKMLIAASKPENFDFQGMALIMKSITAKLIQDMRGREDYRLLLPNNNTCPVCIHLADFMETYVKHVVRLLSSNHEGFSKLFRESKGLCIPHFVSLMRVAEKNNEKKDIMVIITRTEEKSFRRLDLEFAEYIKKQSYEFLHEDREKVENTILRGVEKIAGRRGVRLVSMSERKRSERCLVA